ncbi:MAG: hypothetical protein LYZ70_05740 [Nitrososphaerales archaeon]|nr:hypothetical protein [Nitrososphaerales archaeon]
MVEVLEYALVVLVSTVALGFSFSVYAGYASVAVKSANEAAAAAILSLARTGVEQGTASASFSLDHAAIECESGNLRYVSASYSQSSHLPVTCSFSTQALSGVVPLRFVYSAGQLVLQVG